MAPAPADNSPELMSDLEPTVCRWLWLDVPPGASERSLAVQQPLQPHVPLPTLSPEVTSSPGHPGVRHGGRRASAAPSEHPHGAGGAALASFPGFATTRRAGALTPVPLAVLGHKALGTAVVQGAEHRAVRPGSRAESLSDCHSKTPPVWEPRARAAYTTPRAGCALISVHTNTDLKVKWGQKCLNIDSQQCCGSGRFFTCTGSPRTDPKLWCCLCCRAHMAGASTGLPPAAGLGLRLLQQRAAATLQRQRCCSENQPGPDEKQDHKEVSSL